jgi:VCBS repeat-containing protein
VLDLDANNSSGAAGANFTTSFTEDGGAVLIADADAALSDVDNANLSSLTVTITNLLDGAAESLTANTAGTGITANYNSGTGVLTLSGVDTVANYQQVLRTISYDNTSQNPTTTARTITFQASDGSLSSNPAAASVNVAAQNNAPVASADNFFVQVGEPFTLTTAALLLNDSDVDSSFLSVEIVGGPLHGTLVINADGSFTYASDPIFLGVDTFSYRLSDGDELSEVTTVTLNVQGTVIFPPSPVTSPATPEPTAEVEDEDPNDQSADEAADEPAISAALLPQVRDALAALPIAGNSPQAAVDSEPVEAEQRQAAPETQSAEADAIGRHFQQHSAGLVGVPRSPEGDGLASLESLALDTGAYWDELNSFRGDLQSQHTFELAVVGSAAVVTTALSVGYVVWTLKGGYLLATAMASTPLWRMVDPLPVLNDLPDNFDVLYDSDESLESLVERNSVASASVEA